MSVYDVFKAQLKTLSWIKWIDIDNGQLEDAEKRLPLAYPCVLISDNSVFSNVFENGEMQREDVSIQLRIAWDSTASRTNANAPDTVQER